MKTTAMKFAVAAEFALQLAEIAQLIDHPLGGSLATQVALCLGVGFLIDEIEVDQAIGRLRAAIGQPIQRPDWVDTSSYCGPDRRMAKSPPLRGGRRATDIAIVDHH